MIVIPNKLKFVVEEYIKNGDRKQEQGGYFFGTQSKFVAFLPCPNFSKNPWSKFERGNGDHFAKSFARMINSEIMAEMHTHPSGAVPSESDLRYLKSHSYPYEVIIADMGDKLRWFVVDRNLREIGIIESDEELEKMAFMFTAEIGLIDLGRAFLTPEGELLITTKLGRALLNFDLDTYKIYQIIKNYEPHWKKPSKKELKNLSGLSLTRINKALEKLKELEL